MDTATNRALWWSLVVSLGVYLGIGFVGIGPSDPEAPVAMLTLLFALASLGIAAGTLAWRRRALAGPIQRGELDPTTPEGRAVAFPAFVVNLVLSESVGIFGLVLSLLAASPGPAVPFALGAFALLFAHRPTAPDLQPPTRPGRMGHRPDPIG